MRGVSGEMDRRELAMTDIHGDLDNLVAGLRKARFRPGVDWLTFLGDYGDRGPNTKGVYELVMELSKISGVQALRGNHDDDLLMAALGDLDRFELWIYNGGGATLMSYGCPWNKVWEPESVNRYIPKEVLRWIESLPLYRETEKHIYCHAGVEPGVPVVMAEQRPGILLHIREAFINSEVITDKTVVFGHTPTPLIHGRARVWQEGNKVGIDCGAFFSGVQAVYVYPGKPVYVGRFEGDLEYGVSYYGGRTIREKESARCSGS